MGLFEKKKDPQPDLLLKQVQESLVTLENRMRVIETDVKQTGLETTDLSERLRSAIARFAKRHKAAELDEPVVEDTQEVETHQQPYKPFQQPWKKTGG